MVSDLTNEIYPFIQGIRPNITIEQLDTMLQDNDWDVETVTNLILMQDDEEVVIPVDDDDEEVSNTRVNTPPPKTEWSSIRQEQDDEYLESLRIDQEKQKEEDIQRQRDEFHKECLDFEDSCGYDGGKHKIRLRFPSGKTHIIGMPVSSMTVQQFFEFLDVPQNDELKPRITSPIQPNITNIQEGNVYTISWKN